jgi:hypothetical protein
VEREISNEKIKYPDMQDCYPARHTITLKTYPHHRFHCIIRSFYSTGTGSRKGNDETAPHGNFPVSAVDALRLDRAKASRIRKI